MFGAGETTFHVLAANVKGSFSKVNAKSIVLMVTFKDFDVLLTSDGTFDTEKEIMGRYDQKWLDVEVLKIGHHGSSTTSTSEDWAKATKPEVAVVSCAYKNRFGHPRKDVIERLEPFTLDESTGHKFRWALSQHKFENLEDYREAIYTTARNGSICVRSDGETYTVEFEGMVAHDFGP